MGAWHANGPAIDALDRALFQSIRSCSGRIIDTPAEAGGWPDLPILAGPPDLDRDGMPDLWELERHGPGAVGRPDAWAHEDGSGWSNLEVYLAQQAGDFLPGPDMASRR